MADIALHDVTKRYPGSAAPAVDGLSLTGMGQLGPFSPAGLIQMDPDSDFLKLSVMPHGYPSGHHIQVHPVDGGAAAGGGGACK